MQVKHVLKFLSFWPPYLASGISINEYDLDNNFIKIRLKTSRLNSNIFGTHYGGSLYSMCDPWFVFLIVNRLGKGYLVWDAAASINFIKASKKPVFADFKISPEEILKIKEATEKGDAYRPVFKTTIYSEDSIIARVSKTVYVKKKISDK